MAAVPMGGPLTPPAAFWSVGYARTHSTTTTPKPTVRATERERLAKPYRTAVWSDATNLTRYAQAMLARLLAQRVNKHRSGPPYEFCISSCKRLRNFIWGEVPIRTPFERHIYNHFQ